MGVVVGSVAIPASTGNFSVAGLPFQPVAVVFFNQHEPLGTHSFTMGCASGATEQWAVWTGTGTEIISYNQRKREGRTDAVVFHRDRGTGAELWRASLVSLNASGFTLNLDVRNSIGGGEGENIYYMALGGQHILEAHAGTFSAGASTGAVSVTDPGFTPTCVIFANDLSGAFDAGMEDGMGIGVGLTDGDAQFCFSARGNQGSAVSVNWFQRTDSVACYYDGTFDFRMAHQSFDANGFTVNVTDSTGGGFNIKHGYLAINAEGAVAGNGIQPDANGTVSYTTPGLTPEGVFFCWPGVDSSSTAVDSTAPMRPGVGAGTILQQRKSSGIFRSSAPFGVFTSDGYQLATEPMGFWGTGSGTGGSDNQSQASADIAAMNSGSFDLSWTNVADTTDRRFGWLALPGELATWIPQSYRRL